MYNEVLINHLRSYRDQIIQKKKFLLVSGFSQIAKSHILKLKQIINFKDNHSLTKSQAQAFILAIQKKHINASYQKINRLIDQKHKEFYLDAQLSKIRCQKVNYTKLTLKNTYRCIQFSQNMAGNAYLIQLIFKYLMTFIIFYLITLEQAFIQINNLMQNSRYNQSFFSDYGFPIFYYRNSFPFQWYNFVAQQNQVQNLEPFIKKQPQSIFKEPQNQNNVLNKTQNVERIPQNNFFNQQSSQYKPNRTKTFKGYRQKQSIQYCKKNTQSNIVNQVISFVSDSYRTRKIIENYFQLTPKGFQVFYKVTKKIKKNYGNYLTRNDLINLAILDKTHKGYKLLTLYPSKSKKVQVKPYCQDLPVQTFREILKFLIRYFIIHGCHSCILTSKKIKKQTIFQHLQRKRQIEQLILTDKVFFIKAKPIYRSQ